MFGVLALVGIGSTLLHSTLHWIPQSSDEVPMLWQSLSFLYALLTMNETPKSKTTVLLGYGFILLAVVQTILYYRYQQVYVIFIASFLTYSLINSIWTAYLAFSPDTADKRMRRIRRTIWACSFLCFAVVGGGVWVLDFHGCRYLSPYYLSLPYFLRGMTFHVVWHLSSSFGVYLATLFLVIVRLQTLKRCPKIDFLAGFIPICTLPEAGHDNVTAR